MSFPDAGENCKQFEQSEGKSLDTDAEKQTDSERDSDESVSESIIKLKIIPTERNHKHFGTRKTSAKIPVGRLNVSRYGKHGRHFMKKNKNRKPKERKTITKSSAKSQHRLENQENKVEVSTIFCQKGKRCRMGGKAKGLPPEEDTFDNCESDEETDNYYFSRISIGYFQKFKDKTGASTSHQLEEIYKNPSAQLIMTEELLDKTSEEMELLELQQWGRVNLVSSKGAEKLNRAEDIGPDTI